MRESKQMNKKRNEVILLLMFFGAIIVSLLIVNMHEEKPYYIAGETNWAYSENGELIEGTEDDLLVDAIAFGLLFEARGDDSDMAMWLGASMKGWLLEEGIVSANGLNSPVCRGRFKYVYYDGYPIGYYSNNCKSSAEAMTFFDMDTLNITHVYGNNGFEIRD